MNSVKTIQKFLLVSLFVFSIFLVSCQPGQINQLDILNQKHSDSTEDDLELEPDSSQSQSSCLKADLDQITFVNLGNSKLDQFLSSCRAQTQNSAWCDQVARPNPESQDTFFCTYSPNQPHTLIHPDEQTWLYAIEAVKMVKELETQKIKICTIYNWWRPEPYNKNVGGASGRHPFGTSVDVLFCSKNDQLAAHKKLCAMRKQGRLRALGYYSSTALHIGVGDKVANTWGKSCP